MQQYAKAFVAFFTTAAGSIAQVYSDPIIDVGEVLIAICTVMAATFGVFIVENKDA